MAQESSGPPGCKGRFFRASRGNAVGCQTSSSVSTVYVRSWAALALGLICGAVTFFVLFEDVLRNGAKVTTDHALTLAVLLSLTAAGHMWWREARQFRIFTTVGLVLIFVVGSGYIIVASGGRNAEVAIEKRNAAHSANEERPRVKLLLERAETMLAEAAGRITADCVRGKRGKEHCDGLRETHNVYEAAVKGRKAELERLGAEQEEDGGLKQFARVWLAFRDVKAENREAAEKDIAGRLVLIMPYVKAVLVELATIIFLAVAIGHRRETVSTPHAGEETRKPSPKRETVRKPSTATVVEFPGNRSRKQLTKAEALQDLLEFVRVNGFAPSQETLRERFGVRSKGTVSKWLCEWEDAGLISRASEGRRKVIS